MLLHKKKYCLFEAVNLLLPFFQLPLEAGCFWGLQYFSVDMKITANPISASGTALRFLLLIYKLKKESFSVQIRRRIGTWAQVWQSTKFTIPPPKKISLHYSFSQYSKSAQLSFIIAMFYMYELPCFLLL